MSIRHSERGATAAEYGLLIAIVAGGLVAAALTLGVNLGGVLSDITKQLGSASDSEPLANCRSLPAPANERAKEKSERHCEAKHN